MIVVTNTGYAQPALLKIELDPDTRTIHIKDPQKEVVEPKEIIMIAQTEQGHIRWRLDGPGEIEGSKDSPGIIYVAPTRISGKSAKATVTVTVHYNEGAEVSNSVTFTILVPSSKSRITEQRSVIIVQTPSQPTPTPAVLAPPSPAMGYLQVLVNIPDVKVYVNNSYKGLASPTQPLNLHNVPVDLKMLVRVEHDETSEFKLVQVEPNQWTQVKFRLPDPVIA